MTQRHVDVDHDVRAALERSEQVFRARFEQVPIPQAMVGLDGTYLAVNDALCALIGRPREQVVGHSVYEMRHASNPVGCDESIGGRFRNGQVGSWESVLARPDGTPVPVLVTGAVVTGGDEEVVAVFLQDLSLVREATEQLARREAWDAVLSRHASEWALVLDATGFITRVSASIADALAFRPQDVIATRASRYVHPDDRDRARAAFLAVHGCPRAEERATVRVRDGHGSWHWVEYVFRNLLDDPIVSGIVLNGRDVTARIETENRLRASEAWFRAIADGAGEGIWAEDREGRTVFVNARAAQLLGWDLRELRDLRRDDVLDADLVRTAACDVAPGVDGGPVDVELDYLHPDGSPRVLHLRQMSLPDGVGGGTLSLITDVTDIRNAEEELRRLALHDTLTGTANRALLQDRLAQAVVRAQRSGPSSSVALLFLDLDQFKLVNDTWGHASGDELLVQVAERLSAACRDTDTVARFGGDEFVVVADETDEAAARELAARLRQALDPPFVVRGQRLYVSASIGIALCPPYPGSDLLRLADTAMYDAKRSGRGRLAVFSSSLATQSGEALALASDLREALAADGLEMHYQPIVDLASGRVCGVEALTRWTHPTRGCVAPDTFVAVAESVGLAAQFDQWALSRVVTDLPRLRALLGPGAHVAVNVSARHVDLDGFEDEVLGAVTRSGVDPRGLVLEITETALMADPARAQRVVQRLRDAGVATAIDDFGTGYSSLSYLSKLPVTALKIDRSFVAALDTGGDAVAITSSVVDLAKVLQLQTVAEGVETADQVALLQRLGCDCAQGWLWSKAVPLAELEVRVLGLPSGRFSLGEPRRRTVRRSPDDVSAEHGLHEILRMHRRGSSTTTIAAALNAAGYRTPSGSQWHRARVARVTATLRESGLVVS